MSLMMETEQGTEFFSEEDDLFLESSLDHAEDSLPDQDSDSDVSASEDDTFGSLSFGSISPYSASISSSPSNSSSCTDVPASTSLHWFRMCALRLHDNPALMAALNNPNTRFRAVFIIDTWCATGDKRFGVNRWRFLLECLHNIHRQLEMFGSRLYVAKGQTTSVLANLCSQWDVKHLTYQKSQEPHSYVEEMTINQMASSMDIKVESFHSHTLYNHIDILKANNNKPVITFKVFREILTKLGSPKLPIGVPKQDQFVEEDNTPYIITQKYLIPTLETLGFPNATLGTNPWRGGETEALNRLQTYVKVRSKPFRDPVDHLFDKTSLSPYIRFGCLSVRYLWHYARELAITDTSKEKLAREIASKLLQREFYFLVAQQVPNFDCDRNNPVCIAMPWEMDNNLLMRWKKGCTGYPWIDAAVRQMLQEGWIHHCLRESIATFLTRGDLWITWVKGKDTFEMYMLDYESSVSCGCWMKSSSSAFITGPIEHYCPISFGQQLDPNGRYVRHYIPELKNYPSEYIYCPWTAPIEVQRESGCIIGIDYPYPIIDHMTAGTICVERLKTYLSTLHFACQNEP